MIIQSVRDRNLHQPLISTPPLKQCEVSVIVPVKDEAQTLPATLTALAHQTCLNGVTAEMYGKAGGIPPVRTPEDEAFYQSLLRVNARFRHSLRVQVTTSARASGRSPVGLANQLTKWTEMSIDSALKVEPANVVISRFRSRRKLRSLWQRALHGHQLSFPEIEPLANKLGVGDDWLLKELFRPQTFGGLFEQVTRHQQQNYPSRWPLIDIKTAIMELRHSRALRIEQSIVAFARVGVACRRQSVSSAESIEIPI